MRTLFRKPGITQEAKQYDMLERLKGTIRDRSNTSYHPQVLSRCRLIFPQLTTFSPPPGPPPTITPSHNPALQPARRHSLPLSNSSPSRTSTSQKPCRPSPPPGSKKLNATTRSCGQARRFRPKRSRNAARQHPPLVRPASRASSSGLLLLKVAMIHWATTWYWDRGGETV